MLSADIIITNMQNGENIGQYKVVFPIDKGSYTETYRVTDSEGNKFFLKLFNLAKLTEKQYGKSITDIKEINIVKMFAHPNVPKFVDSGECIVDGQRYVYMVCDYVIGETVEAKFKRENLCSVYDMKQIVVGVLNALKYLHQFNPSVIHNNITPENIMIDMSHNSIQPMLVGFGHAQLLDSDADEPNFFGLNPFYMATEMYKGLYSTRTDLYSVGVLMYHLLFGIEPWYVNLALVPSGERIKSVLNERKQPLKIPNIQIFELDERLLNIIAKALAQDVDKRFKSADEFLRALNGEVEINGVSYVKVNQKDLDEESSSAETNAKKGNGFADVAGMDDLKQRLREEVIDLIKNPEKYKKLKVKIPNGMLLYGPPGCGKTFIAEKFAEEVGCNYMYVHCSDVASPYIHGGQGKIAEIFQSARENAPTVLFLDELDAMLADRSKHNNVSEYGEVNEFLTQLNNCADNNVFVIGATNNPKGIDPAALRSGRLDMKVYVPAPDLEARKGLFELCLSEICTDDIDYDDLAKQTEGYVSKDICTLVNKAALITAKADKEKVSMEELRTVMKKSKGELPSVSSKALSDFENIRNEFENKSSSRPRVGFK